ncbi:MAG: dockerin type I repeat-containing protein [Clostridia bacterium]|nr:dockerin type I repeat-containing protein [Clostridia bacterium]
MKKAKKLSAVFLAVCVALVIPFASFNVIAAAPTAVCTVEVTEQNAGTENYCVAADVTFESEYEFTAGLFTVEAENFAISDCTVKSAVGGEAPEVQFEADTGRVIFTGFSNSEQNDFRSYTSLTLTVKLNPNGGQTGNEIKVAVKNINIANVDEVKFITADAEGTVQAAHNHTVGDTFEKNETYHWKVCTTCQAEVDKAAHTFDTAVTSPTCTAGGYTTYTCTVCGYSYTGDETDPTDHTLGDWLTDETNHWKVCSGCEGIFEQAAHIESDWIIDTPATTEAAGHRHKECTVCGYHTAEEDIEKLSGDHTPGDINNDGSVNNKDLTRLFQYLSDWEVEVNAAALDVNGDGSVNNKDLTRLFQYLSDWDVEIF